MSDFDETQPKGRFPVSMPKADPMPAKAEAPAAAKKTIEEWGLAKGFLPQTRPRNTAAVTQGGFKGVALAGAPEHNPEYWKFAAAKAGNAWPQGFECTEAEFDIEIERHTNLAHG
jgi:hypothetical protein